MDANNSDDEDVVIQGTALYEHLRNSGYTDFESVTISRSTLEKEEGSSRLMDCVRHVKNVFKKLPVVYFGIIQDDSVSKKQVETILNAKVLLNDHACMINGFVDRYDFKSWRTVLLKCVLFGTIVSYSIYSPFSTQYKSSSSLLGLFVLCCAGYIEYSRARVHRDLSSVISLQNDLFDLCKKGLRILRYGYRMKLSKDKGSRQLYDLTADRLKYLQPITENVVKYLEHASHTYYHVSVILTKLLPADALQEDPLTRFENGSFQMRGEVNYQKLKDLYHTYVLTQSEMLHLLAVSYDSHTWRQSYSRIPEVKLARIVRFLKKYLTVYKDKLSKAVGDYYSFTVQPKEYKYKGPATSRWRDLHMHLYLASNKLEIAYGHVSSILQDIDNNIDENISDEDSVEEKMQRLSAAQKDIANAKDFIEFSTLFLLKSRITDYVGNHSAMNMLTSAASSDLPVIYDSEPEILDEVFEEYIKDEYLKPLSDDSDEIELFNCKKDRALFKNFMAELKDALVDKQKSVAERELKALQRMRGYLANESALEDEANRVPTPPPMPELNKPGISREISRGEENLKEEKQRGSLLAERSPISVLPLPTTKEFSLFLPPPFLKASEETFAGSGENSEDEIVETENGQ